MGQRIRRYFGLVETFYQGQNDRGWYSDYYDDECWMTLARETNANIFSVNWAGPAQTNIDQAQHNAACMALNRFAHVLGYYSGPGTSPG